MRRHFRALPLLIGAGLPLAPAPARAEAGTELPVTAEAPAPARPDAAQRQVFVPADFARFAPRNAWDILTRVPGFSIRESDTQRGLGQATGNVLFNGARPSNKSDDLYTQLNRIPAANVERIEILDGATLDIPGLSGQVADVVYKADGFSGQFSWVGRMRAHYADALYTFGDISVSGRSGAVEFELGLNNADAGRSAAGGPTLIRDAAGLIIERRRDEWTSNYDAPKLTGRLTLDGPGSSVGHLAGHVQRSWDHYRETSLRTGSPDLADRRRRIRENNDTRNWEISGDYEFALGPGRLKLIGLTNARHEPYRQEVIDRPIDGSAASGDRFTQTSDLAETIARGEYGWTMLGGDWQLSGEAAFNTLDSVATLAEFDPVRAAFVSVDFPDGTGGVREDRYEAMLSFGRPISKTLSLQITAGAEHSTISQTGLGGATRSFFRPKGTVSLAWKPAKDFDLSVKLQRRVLQLEFYDFLASVSLNDNNQNASNADLRPQQDWSIEAEANKRLGRWGSTKLILTYRDVEDRVDIIPVAGGGEAVGNIAKARAAAFDWYATLELAPLGWKGARLDTHVLLQDSSLRDPFTGQKRNWNGFSDRLVELNLRHDIPGGDWAWGSGLYHEHIQPGYRSNQQDRVWEGPMWIDAFVENKDILGLTVRAAVNNIANARSRRERVVYTGMRGASPIAFRESRDRLIGPIFILSIKGTF
ncbi:TonB-dependent receptor plug domain-containing protein [Novosphingobium album (ex Liu et al. 2023)]|uniref:TonB-dependent receptor plug domain-containing protein n=1 Tax=Novosphingobium album (ex Liu et al. 2023) TaxID=3031130 RepID=A0ABT5WN99_9SPHN|nr:TonB-dependent receptor plug domain-containing protein [Novosphingobium album (ex Liu et al. 2023)]MDE8650413.1 TonB-dependent receptor plug domain-containing protein [Novosphingobium album (ex Liu et al. 2023)]